jgi:putative transposase
MDIEKDIPDQVLVSCDPSKAFSGVESFDLLKKALVESGSEAKIDDRWDRQADMGWRRPRSRYSNKKMSPPASQLDIRAVRAREDAFHGERMASAPYGLSNAHEKILSMYARGMSAREIQRHLFELYGIDFSRDTISMATETVPAMIARWQNRHLAATYPLVFFDALRVEIGDEGLVRSKVVYIALGIQADGAKDVLGMWIENPDAASFWSRVMSELKIRGVSDMLIAVVDGLKGIAEAINVVFPRTIVLPFIVHLIRHSIDFPCWADRKVVAGALKTIYQAKDANAAMAALNAFSASYWGEKYPVIVQDWRRNWEQVIRFFLLPEAVRRIIYARKAVESLNEKLRRAVRARGHFPTDEAALFLVLRNSAGERKMAPREWFQAKIQLALMFNERFVQT